MTSSYSFTDKENHDNLLYYFKVFLDITNEAPNDMSTSAQKAWEIYADALHIEDSDPQNRLKSLYKFHGTEREETALINSMYNALLVFGPLSPDSDYVVCRCCRVVLKKDHYELKNPNADCCKLCVNTYDEDQFSANKLFEFPTSLQTDEVFDPSEPMPECPIGINNPLEWGSSLCIQIPSDPENEAPIASPKPYLPSTAVDEIQQVQSSYGPVMKKKRAYNARRKCSSCGGPNLNRKKTKCNSCLHLK